MKLKMRAVLILLVVVILLMEFSECGKSRGKSRSSSSSRRRSSTSSTRRRTASSGTSYAKPKVYRNTPIYATARHSPVIVSQTQVRRRGGMSIPKVIVGYMLIRYTLGRSPVYRGHYPMRRSHVDVYIPSERALRVVYTDEQLLDSAGNLCINSTQNITLRDDLSENKQQVHTFVSYKYKDDFGSRIRQVNFTGENVTVTVDTDFVGQSVEVVNLVKYNITLAANVTCTQIKTIMNGTVVQMYQYNPDSGANLKSDAVLLLLSAILLLLLRN